MPVALTLVLEEWRAWSACRGRRLREVHKFMPLGRLASPFFSSGGCISPRSVVSDFLVRFFKLNIMTRRSPAGSQKKINLLFTCFPFVNSISSSFLIFYIKIHIICTAFFLIPLSKARGFSGDAVVLSGGEISYNSN
jgi:hypothetical protein